MSGPSIFDELLRKALEDEQAQKPLDDILEDRVTGALKARENPLEYTDEERREWEASRK